LREVEYVSMLSDAARWHAHDVRFNGDKREPEMDVPLPESTLGIVMELTRAGERWGFGEDKGT
jgi:hypothetical protein